MRNWLRYMAQEEMTALQHSLSVSPWTPPTRDQVERMLQEIRTAQTERSALDRAALATTLRKAAELLEKGRA